MLPTLAAFGVSDFLITPSSAESLFIMSARNLTSFAASSALLDAALLGVLYALESEGLGEDLKNVGESGGRETSKE